MPSNFEEILIKGDAQKELELCEREGQVDLVYIDPPFYTNKKWVGVNNQSNEESEFDDTWNCIDQYMEMMDPILENIKRLLSKTGSFYLHCDYHAYGELRSMCDRKFGEDKLINEIYWKRHNRNRTGKQFGNIMDVILLYGKSSEYTFHPPLNSKHKKRFPLIEKETGRHFTTHGLVKKNLLTKTLNFNGKIYTIQEQDLGFVWTQDTLNERLEKNSHLIYWGKSETTHPRYKLYEDEYNGITLTNLWDDIPGIMSNDPNYLYPTQKPIELLERIILTSSDENDLVLDCFCGSGTTLEAAKKHHRQYIGIDKKTAAMRITAERIGYPLIKIRNYPLSDIEIDGIEGYELQMWVCSMLNATCGPKGSDDGIDGWTRVTNIPIQVKSNKITDGMLSNFKTKMDRSHKKIGIFVGRGITSKASSEITYWRRQGIDIHYYTPQQVISKDPYKVGLCKERSFQSSLIRADINKKSTLTQFFNKKVELKEVISK